MAVGYEKSLAEGNAITVEKVLKEIADHRHVAAAFDGAQAQTAEAQAQPVRPADDQRVAGAGLYAYRYLRGLPRF